MHTPMIRAYPARGLLGALAVKTTTDSLNECRSKGRTESARFDLAIEIPRARSMGYLTWDADRRYIPDDWKRASWESIA